VSAIDLNIVVIKSKQTLIHSRIFQKLYASFVLIILFCTAIISLMIARQMQHDSLLETENSLKSQAIIIRQSILPALSSDHVDNLQQRIIQMTHGIETRITIISKDGIVLADSQQDPVTMDNHRERPELQQANETGLGVITRYSQTLSRSMRYMAMPIDESNYELGFIRVALPLSHIDQRMDHLRNIVIVAASLTAIIALLLGFWIARSFADPLQRMTDMAKLLSTGDYKQRVNIDRQDEIGELATSLNSLAQTASQREAIRRDFIANASHELKTPVTAIQGLTETLLEDSGMDAETHQSFLQKVYKQSMRLSQLVSDLLALSRLESDDSESFDKVDLKEIIFDSCNALQAIAKEKYISLKIEAPENKAVLSGDEKSLSQLIVNLVDNAIKYTPENGNVIVRLIIIDDQTIIEIEDDGIGIAKEEQQRIFERFYRVDKARSRTLGGTGLGLSIVKHIAFKHQGHISLESTLDQGSLFRITLPIQK
jgi:two-component system, OmpR family, phosphate regulon sensor histidine kinase PhoR